MVEARLDLADYIILFAMALASITIIAVLVYGP
jgi:hypothetical protein